MLETLKKSKVKYITRSPNKNHKQTSLEIKTNMNHQKKHTQHPKPTSEMYTQTNKTQKGKQNHTKTALKATQITPILWAMMKTHQHFENRLLRNSSL